MLRLLFLESLFHCLKNNQQNSKYLLFREFKKNHIYYSLRKDLVLILQVEKRCQEKNYTYFFGSPTYFGKLPPAPSTVYMLDYPKCNLLKSLLTAISQLSVPTSECPVLHSTLCTGTWRAQATHWALCSLMGFEFRLRLATWPQSYIFHRRVRCLFPTTKLNYVTPRQFLFYL